jgi:AAA15 family ATPase/GTPase
MFSRIQFQDWPTVWRSLNGGTQFSAVQIREAQAINIANYSTGPEDINQAWSNISKKIYRFSSERIVQPICSHSNHNNGELFPNSSNLAFCINNLQSTEKDLFDLLNRLLHRVFPTIHWIGAPASWNGQNTFELKVHTTPSRGDLAVPINQVGTGVGNALAMLYVALTSRTQRFILLEEPNSFLHPRALRELNRPGFHGGPLG